MQIVITKVLLKVATNTRYTRFGNDFLDMKPKAQVTRGKIDTLDYVKIEDFWTSKDTINRLEKEPTEWTIPVNHAPDKGMYEEPRINGEIQITQS